MTLGAVVAPINYAHQLDDTVRQSVWNKPAIDLEKENGEKLIAMGVQARAVRDLQRNKWFSPTLQTALVARLEAFGNISGIESVVKAATVTQGESRARFLLESLGMLVTHHQKQGKFASIKMSNLVPVGVAADGSIVVSVAIDYGTWSKEAAAFAQRTDFNTAKKAMLVAGKLSPRTQEAFEKSGWTIKAGLRS